MKIRFFLVLLLLVPACSREPVAFADWVRSPSAQERMNTLASNPSFEDVNAELESTVIDPHGTAADACDAAEIEAKFRLLAQPVADGGRIERVIGAVSDLRGALTVAALSAALHG